ELYLSYSLSLLSLPHHSLLSARRRLPPPPPPPRLLLCLARRRLSSLAWPLEGLGHGGATARARWRYDEAAWPQGREMATGTPGQGPGGRHGAALAGSRVCESDHPRGYQHQGARPPEPRRVPGGATTRGVEEVDGAAAAAEPGLGRDGHQYMACRFLPAVAVSTARARQSVSCSPSS
ncbi:unnamed protein product, partial [Urochloa humidicola]